MRRIDFIFSLSNKDVENFKKLIEMMDSETLRCLKLIYPVGEMDKKQYNIAIKKRDACEIVHLLEKMREIEGLSLELTIFIERMIERFNNRVKAEAGLMRMKLKYNL